MSELRNQLSSLDVSAGTSKTELVGQIKNEVDNSGYTIVELNEEKPWGAYLRFDGGQADEFVNDFFPDLSSADARLGNNDAELSPKILVVSPEQRLSWQYHDRRAERWTFLTEGAYNKSTTDEPGELIKAIPGDVVQFAQGERHRLAGVIGKYTLVAEIWQHTDSDNLSDEDDIVRLQDDYSR